MQGTKIVKNGDVGVSDVVWSEFLKWAAKVATGVAIVIVATSILGAWAFFQRIDKTISALDDLTLKVNTLVTTTEKYRDQDRTDKAAIMLGQSQLKQRVAALDKKTD